MTCRTENGVTYIQSYNTENRISSIAKLASGTCASPGNYLAKWDFSYDGDGVHVATLITPYDSGGNPQTPSLTSYYFGGAYEVTGANTKKYYSFAGGAVAMRDANGLQYFLTDHLGSVDAVTDSSGTLTSQQRYLPFGQERTDVGSIGQTDYGYTGQRDLNLSPGSGQALGLMDYKARFYSPDLNRWTQPDALISDLFNPQTLDRFSYVINNPTSFIDPTGNTACEGGNWDDGPRCETRHPGIFTGCSARYGVFNGRGCTIDDFRQANWNARKNWLKSFAGENDYGAWFNDMGAAVDFMGSDNDLGHTGGIAEVADAGVLQAINDGWLISKHQKPVGAGGQGWADFFNMLSVGRTTQAELNAARLAAEQKGVNYATELQVVQQAEDRAAPFEQDYFDVFLWSANHYRKLGQNFSEWVDPRKTGPLLAQLSPLVKLFAYWIYGKGISPENSTGFPSTPYQVPQEIKQ